MPVGLRVQRSMRAHPQAIIPYSARVSGERYNSNFVVAPYVSVDFGEDFSDSGRVEQVYRTCRSEGSPHYYNVRVSIQPHGFDTHAHDVGKRLEGAPSQLVPQLADGIGNNLNTREPAPRFRQD